MSSSVTTYEDSGLISGAGYTYRVRAVASGGASPYSNPVRIVAVNGGARNSHEPPRPGRFSGAGFA